MPLMLGKHAPKFHPRTLFYHNYHVAVPPPPPVSYYYKRLRQSDWLMLGNDNAGDCAIAAPAHQAFLSTSYTRAITNPTLDDVIKAYSAISGYDPATGANDNGCAMTDVWNYVSTTGIGQYKIAGWVQIDPTNLTHVRQAIHAFGGVQIGVQLPNSAMDQFNAGQDWTVVQNDGGIAGGHAIYGCGYPDGNNIAVVSWGRALMASLPWLAKYCDEMYAIVSLDFIYTQSGLSPSHLNIDALKQDLLALQQ
jgi:hypothetical protein